MANGKRPSRWPALTAPLALLAIALTLAGLVAIGPAAARQARSSTACPAFTGPAWTYKTGTGPASPVYQGTHYTFSTVRISSPSAQRLIRKIIPQTAKPPGPAALRYAPGYGCIVGSTWLIGKKMFAGQCFSAPTSSGKGPGAAGGFAWSPKLKDPSSKRIK